MINLMYPDSTWAEEELAVDGTLGYYQVDNNGDGRDYQVVPPTSEYPLAYSFALFRRKKGPTRVSHQMTKSIRRKESGHENQRDCQRLSYHLDGHCQQYSGDLFHGVPVTMRHRSS